MLKKLEAILIPISHVLIKLQLPQEAIYLLTIYQTFIFAN